MRSREAVGKVFLDSPVDAIVFQAGVVIGSGFGVVRDDPAPVRNAAR